MTTPGAVPPVLGLIGGIAPESTVDYYRRLIAAYRARRGEGEYPHIIINSINLTTMLGLVGAGRLAELVTFLAGEVERLARAGAELAILASNTPHLVFDDLAKVSPLPLVSLVEAARDAARARRLRRVGLIGTRFTMQGGFYQAVFGGAGIAVVVPGAEEQEYVHARYLGEIALGEFRDETREGFLALIRTMQARDGLDGLVLGGTELPLLLRGSAVPGCPFLDTTALHVEAVIARLLGPA